MLCCVLFTEGDIEGLIDESVSEPEGEGESSSDSDDSEGGGRSSSEEEDGKAAGEKKKKKKRSELLGCMYMSLSFETCVVSGVQIPIQ